MSYSRAKSRTFFCEDAVEINSKANDLYLVCYIWSFFSTQEETGKDGAADTVPGARDGAGKHSQRLGSKEIPSQDGGQSGILHAYLYGNGAFLGLIEACQASCCIAEEIA